MRGSLWRVLGQYLAPAGLLCEDGAARGKRNQDDRRKFTASLIRWADAQRVTLEEALGEEIHDGFSDGDDAFDAVVGLLGMFQVCLGQSATGEPDERIIREIEGWILGRKP